MTFPSNPAEYEEYVSIMNEMADQAIASTPDPEPENFGGRCEDAPCCGCCGNDTHDSDDEGHDDFDPEDRYLDSRFYPQEVW